MRNVKVYRQRFTTALWIGCALMASSGRASPSDLGTELLSCSVNYVSDQTLRHNGYSNIVIPLPNADKKVVRFGLESARKAGFPGQILHYSFFYQIEDASGTGASYLAGSLTMPVGRQYELNEKGELGETDQLMTFHSTVNLFGQSYALQCSLVQDDQS